MTIESEFCCGEIHPLTVVKYLFANPSNFLANRSISVSYFSRLTTFLGLIFSGVWEGVGGGVREAMATRYLLSELFHFHFSWSFVILVWFYFCVYFRIPKVVLRIRSTRGSSQHSQWD